ncbi:hypothetical protein BaRGS_00032786 [Batillaria attramentaria]|uniref:Uncharacterized protein n=1 Tax=Batillaria attramentaria TaxID=370345 RepID=A0ABD0JNB4_9CAEN
MYKEETIQTLRTIPVTTSSIHKPKSTSIALRNPGNGHLNWRLRLETSLLSTNFDLHDDRSFTPPEVSNTSFHIKHKTTTTMEWITLKTEIPLSQFQLYTPLL